MESARVWEWDVRTKQLLMATLAYGLRLPVLASSLAELRVLALRTWCQRTGKRYQELAAPLYRLRSALSRLWQPRHHQATIFLC